MESIGLVVQKVRNGSGVIATREFSQGEIVFLFGGVLLGLKEASLLSEEEKSNTIRFSATEYLSPKGTFGNFLNHSCDPNSYVKKDGAGLSVIAIRDIKPGEEVTMDYSTVLARDDDWTMECNCGSQNCRKMIIKFDLLDEAIKEKYRKLGAVPEYID